MKKRKHIRLRNFDYSSQGWYFITICTKNRKHYFGEIKDGQMHLSAIGEQANLYWEEIPQHFPHIELNEFIIMPNHIHGIIGIVSTDTTCRVPTKIPIGKKTNEFGKTIAGSISAIIGQFKSTLTRWSRKNGHENFAWHVRFHDHIIRDDRAFQNISNYIKNNPGNWGRDKFK